MPGLSINQEKRIRSLWRKKGRDEANRFLAEGTKTVQEFLASGFEVVELCATGQWLAANSVPGGVNVTLADAAQLKKVSALATPSPVLAVIEKRKAPAVPDLVTDLVLCLDRINDPGNLGTLIRLADWFGIASVFCSAQTVDVYNPKVVQATMGSLARVEVGVGDLPGMIRSWKKQNGDLGVFAADMQGQPYSAAGMDAPAVLILGSESHGVDPVLMKEATQAVTIPGQGGAESLNVALAGAILCAELRRN